MIKYQESNMEVIHIEFTVDFDTEERKYERCIDISGVDKTTIGSKHRICSIVVLNNMMTQVYAIYQIHATSGKGGMMDVRIGING